MVPNPDTVWTHVRGSEEDWLTDLLDHKDTEDFDTVLTQNMNVDDPTWTRTP